MNENERLRIKAQKHLEHAEMYLGFGKPFWKRETADKKMDGLHRRINENTDHKYTGKLGGVRERMRNRSIAGESKEALHGASLEAAKALTHMLLGRWEQTMTSGHRDAVRKNCDSMLNKDQWKEMKMNPVDFDALQNACLRSRVKEPEHEIIERSSGVVEEVLGAFKAMAQYKDWERAMQLTSKNPNEVYALMLHPKNVVNIAKYLPNHDKGVLRRLLTDYLYKNKADPE